MTLNFGDNNLKSYCYQSLCLLVRKFETKKEIKLIVSTKIKVY